MKAQREAFPEECARALAALSGDKGQPFRSARTIADSRVELIVKLYDDSHVDELVDTWISEDRENDGTRPGGRTRKAPHRLVLILLMLLACDGRTSLLTEARRLLLYELSPRAIDLLGVDLDSATPTQWAQCLWRTWDSLTRLVDPMRLQGDRRKRQMRSDFEAEVAMRDPVDGARRQQRLDTLTNLLVEASVYRLPRSVRRRWKGDVSVDATLLESFVKHGSRTVNPKPDDLLCVEPNASYYKGGLDVGYDLHTAATTAPEPGRLDVIPFLIAAVSCAPCSIQPGRNGAKCLESLASRGHPTGCVVTDRGYFASAHPDNFQNRARKAGYTLIGTYKDNQLGIQAGHEGAMMVEGWWYCPHMPEALVTATADLRAGRIDDETAQKRIGQRSLYAFRAVERTRPADPYRLMCPAVGPSATVNCTIATRSRFTKVGRPTVRAKKSSGKVCDQRTVTFSPESGAKFRQDVPFRTPEWKSRFKTDRNIVESSNAKLKDPTFAQLDRPGRRRARGYASQFLFATIRVVAVNLDMIAKFLTGMRDGTLKVRADDERPDRWDIDDGSADDPPDETEVAVDIRPTTADPPVAA